MPQNPWQIQLAVGSPPPLPKFFWISLSICTNSKNVLIIDMQNKKLIKPNCLAFIGKKLNTLYWH